MKLSQFCQKSVDKTFMRPDWRISVILLLSASSAKAGSLMGLAACFTPGLNPTWQQLFGSAVPMKHPYSHEPEQVGPTNTRVNANGDMTSFGNTVPARPLGNPNYVPPIVTRSMPGAQTPPWIQMSNQILSNRQLTDAQKRQQLLVRFGSLQNIDQSFGMNIISDAEHPDPLETQEKIRQLLNSNISDHIVVAQIRQLLAPPHTGPRSAPPLRFPYDNRPIPAQPPQPIQQQNNLPALFSNVRSVMNNSNFTNQQKLQQLQTAFGLRTVSAKEPTFGLQTVSGGYEPPQVPPPAPQKWVDPNLVVKLSQQRAQIQNLLRNHTPGVSNPQVDAQILDAINKVLNSN